MTTAGTVILLHGLARSHRSMRKLEKALQQAGFHTLNLNYPSTRHDVETLATMVIPAALKRCHGARRIHFVTHSMGGILLRCYLQQHAISQLGRVVMLAPPNGGSEVAARLQHCAVFSTFFGPAALQLGHLPKTLGVAGFELGVIAGNRRLNPLFQTWLRGENDGTITVDNTRLTGMSDHLTLPISHPFIMTDAAVIAQVIFFLREGKFQR
jgi:pimeloyl-ACP methyl ester carboxylesterase